MFGFIKNLIAGILGFLSGLLGGKKGNGYYLELDESGQKSTPAATAKPTETTNGAKAPAPEPAQAVAAPAPAASSTAKSPKSKSAKAAKVEASKNGKAAPAEPAQLPAAASASTQAPTETTFAPKYLAPSASGSNGRRLPGANMSAYLDMARQVKTSNSN